jgi:hypothetical protein
MIALQVLYPGGDHVGTISWIEKASTPSTVLLVMSTSLVRNPEIESSKLVQSLVYVHFCIHTFALRTVCFLMYYSKYVLKFDIRTLFYVLKFDIRTLFYILKFDIRTLSTLSKVRISNLST